MPRMPSRTQIPAGPAHVPHAPLRSYYGQEQQRRHMQYPWDIKNEFTAAGLTYIDAKPWSALWPGELTPENEWQEEMHAYDAFLFRVNGRHAHGRS